MRTQQVIGTDAAVAGIIHAANTPIDGAGAQLPMMPTGSSDTVMVDETMALPTGNAAHENPAVAAAQTGINQPVMVNFNGVMINFNVSLDGFGRMVLVTQTPVLETRVPELHATMIALCAGKSAAVIQDFGGPCTMPLLTHPNAVNFAALKQMCFLPDTMDLERPGADSPFKNDPGVPHWLDVEQCTNGMPQVPFGTPGADNANAHGDWTSPTPRTWEQVGGRIGDPDPNTNHEDYTSQKAAMARIARMCWLWLQITEAEGTVPMFDHGDVDDANYRQEKRQRVAHVTQTNFQTETRGGVFDNDKFCPNYNNTAVGDDLPQYFNRAQGEVVNLNRVCRAAMIKHFGKHVAATKMMVMIASQSCWTPDGGIDCMQLVVRLKQFFKTIFGGEWQATVGPYYHCAGCGGEVYVMAVETLIICIWKTTGGSQVKVIHKGAATFDLAG